MKFENEQRVKQLISGSFLCAAIFLIPVFSFYSENIEFFAPAFFVLGAIRLIDILCSEKNSSPKIPFFKSVEGIFFFLLSLIILGFVIWLMWNILRS